MISFPRGFFENEYREDFLVDSTMKTVWAAGMEVLYEVAAVCEKYQLPWYADWGTLLGAVRHKGFVPWDDDIDICMLREDYQKLLEVLQDELPPDFRVYHANCGNPQEQFWACVMNATTISIEKERLERFHGCPFIVGVDIFPLDYIPKSKKADEMEKAIFELLMNTAELAKTEKRDPESERQLAEAIKEIEKIFHKKINRSENEVGQIWTLANELCMSYNRDGGDQVACYISYLRKGVRFDLSWFDETQYLPFESVVLPVPSGYDAVLKAEYGDYSVCLRNQQTHDYPLYKDQLEQLRQQLLEMEKKVANS